jgi:hypothetical protein
MQAAHLEHTNFGTYFVIFSLIWAPKTHLCIGTLENKDKRFFQI